VEGVEAWQGKGKDRGRNKDRDRGRDKDEDGGVDVGIQSNLFEYMNK
jgi:hypothetical protein